MLDVLDFTIALTLAQHDVGIFAFRDVGGTERQRHSLQHDAVGFDPLAESRETFDAPRGIEFRRRQSAANVIHAERGANGENCVGGVVLRAALHAAGGSWRAFRGLGRDRMSNDSG